MVDIRLPKQGLIGSCVAAHVAGLAFFLLYHIGQTSLSMQQ